MSSDHETPPKVWPTPTQDPDGWELSVMLQAVINSTQAAIKENNKNPCMEYKPDNYTATPQKPQPPSNDDDHGNEPGHRLS